jgi:hypothetical protein
VSKIKSISCEFCITKAICLNRSVVKCSLLAQWIRKYYVMNVESLGHYLGSNQFRMIYTMYGVILLFCTIHDIIKLYHKIHSSTTNFYLKDYINYIASYPSVQIIELVSLEK